MNSYTDELAQLILIVLLIYCAIASFIAGVAMLLVRPARIDPDTGEPSYVWKACTFLMFSLCAANVRGVFSVQVNNIDSWWAVAIRILVSLATTYVLWALWHRNRAIKHGKRTI